MTFDSLAFAVFLAIVFPFYVALRSWTAKKNVLLLASCVFYAAWNPIFLLLLAATTIFDWWAAKRIHTTVLAGARRRWMWASILISLAVLGYFKYAQFFADTAIAGFAAVGVTYKPLDLGIVLPLGISFYTFESISYIVDVYKKRVAPTRSLRDYGLFMTFFPHLVAGPIMRFADFNSQVATPRVVTLKSVTHGAELLAGGLFLKIVCADQIFSPLSDTVFSPTYTAGFIAAWIGAFSFSMQVYCDFAGYSLAAIGIAMMFGFQLPANFESPFASVGIAELWTRWHISLSNWLRDYVFQPLGHYRRGRVRGYLNLIITFVACGLWHGAAWHFVIWGAIHGIFLVTERLLKDSLGHFTIWSQRPVRCALALLTFVLFSFAVVFFRAPSLAVAWQRVTAMFGGAAANASTISWNNETIIFVVGLGVGLGTQAWLKSRRGWDWVLTVSLRWRITIFVLLVLCICFTPSKSSTFIYFQF